MEATRTCSIDDCEKPAKTAGWCGMHYMRWWKRGDPLRTERAGNWTGDDATYNGVHHRLRIERGKAGVYPCQRCDRQASQWAYDHGDPAERMDEQGRRYSVDLARYMPLCGRCHLHLDRGRPDACPQGHAYTEDNIVPNRNGRLSCLTCKRDRNRQYMAERYRRRP